MYETTIQKHTCEKHPAKILLKTNHQWAKDEEDHVKIEKNEIDEIDEYHKPQLKCEYNVHKLYNRIFLKPIQKSKLGYWGL